MDKRTRPFRNLSNAFERLDDAIARSRRLLAVAKATCDRIGDRR